MSDAKITDLGAMPAVSSTDVLVMVDVSDNTMAASGTDKKITAGATAVALAPLETHTASQISDFTEVAQDTVGAMLISTSTIVQVYNDGAGQQTAALGISPYDLPQNSKTITQTDYTLVSGDNGYWIEFTGSQAITVSIPPNSSASIINVAWSASNIGQITFAGAGAAKVYNPTGLKSRTTSSVGGLFRVATDRWFLFGDTSA